MNSIGCVGKWNYLHHFPHAVSDAFSIYLGYLRWCEVGGYDGEELIFVSPCENIHGWVDNVAEIDEAVKEKTIFSVAKGEIVIDSKKLFKFN